MKLPFDKKKTNFFLIPQTVKTPFLIIYLLTLVSALLTLTFYFRTQPVIPIFYSLPEPEQHLAAKEWIFIFPTLMFFVSLVHTSFTRFLNRSEKLLLNLFAWTTVVVQTVFLLALLRIVYIIS